MDILEKIDFLLDERESHEVNIEIDKMVKIINSNVKGCHLKKVKPKYSYADKYIYSRIKTF